MLEKIVTFLLLGLLSFSARAESDLGDVVLCAGKAPAARFSIGQNFDPFLKIEDLLAKIQIFSPKLSERIRADISGVTDSLRWTSAKFKNLDGDFLNGCVLQQLYQRNTTLGGKVFFVVDQALFQSLSISEQNIFLLEMSLFLSHEKFEDRMDLPGVLAAEGAILNFKQFSKADWLSLIPRAWISSIGSQGNCFIPAEFFDSLFCLHEDFDRVSATGAMLPFDQNQKTPFFGAKIFAEQLYLVGGQIDTLYWPSSTSKTAIQYKSSLFFPENIRFSKASGGGFEPRITIKYSPASTFICANQRLTLRAGSLEIESGGCVTHAYRTEIVEGEARTRDGTWYRLTGYLDPQFDNQGYLIK